MEPTARIESRWPWGLLGIGTIFVLSIVFLWIPSSLRVGPNLLADPANVIAPLFLLVYFALGRRMIGNAAAIVATALLAISSPFLDSARAGHPVLLAETLALAGVAWLIGIEASHREVGLTARSAAEAGFAGVFFGVSLLIHPAPFSTMLAAILLWGSLGLRRSRAVTLPSLRPAASVAWGLFGCIAIAAVAAGTIVALTASGVVDAAQAFPFTLTRSSDPTAVWADAYRAIVSPIRETDVLVIAAIAIVALIASIESLTGSSWHGAGLLPWIFLLLFVMVGTDAPFGGLRASLPEAFPLPAVIPPLFILGLGWLALRGFSPGRVRRQEYTFLLVWLMLASIFLPFAVASEASSPRAPASHALSVASLTILPMVVLIAARAGRAFWETERGVLARIGILAFASLPVVAAVVEALARAGSGGEIPGWAIAFDRWLPLALGIAASLGALSVLVTVRPDPIVEEAPEPGGRRRGFRGHRRRRGGRGRPHRGRPPQRD
jgi:hypothetical protein